MGIRDIEWWTLLLSQESLGSVCRAPYLGPTFSVETSDGHIFIVIHILSQPSQKGTVPVISGAEKHKFINAS